jgi:hypothetical protein
LLTFKKGFWKKLGKNALVSRKKRKGRYSPGQVENVCIYISRKNQNIHNSPDTLEDKVALLLSEPKV